MIIAHETNFVRLKWILTAKMKNSAYGIFRMGKYFQNFLNFSSGSDTSPVNIYLLRKKYNIEVAESNGVLFRRYNGSNINRRGYSFPLSANIFDLNKAIRILAEDSTERGENLRFCLSMKSNEPKLIKLFLSIGILLTAIAIMFIKGKI